MSDVDELVQLVAAMRAAGMNPASARVGRAAVSLYPPPLTASSLAPIGDAPDVTEEDVMRETGAVYLKRLNALDRTEPDPDDPAAPHPDAA